MRKGGSSSGMEEGSGAPTAPFGRSGLLEDNADLELCAATGNECGTSDYSENNPRQIKRNKKTRGCNLRKSLAWNQAFFTEEGVLNPSELSSLNGPVTKSSPGALSGISVEMSPLTAYNKCSGRPPLHHLEENMVDRGARTQTRDTKAGELSSKPEASSEQPQAHVASGKIQSSKGISRSMPPSPITSSQKRVANINKAHPASKIPKFTPAKSQASSVSMNFSSATVIAESSKSVQTSATVNIEQTVGSSGMSQSSSKYSAHDHGINMMSDIEKGTTSLKVVKGSSISTKTREAICSAGLGKTGSTLPKSINRVSRCPPAGAFAKPSALRMPSPSLGFFCQAKVSPSYSSQSQSHIQPSEPSFPSFRKHPNLKNVGELRPPPLSTVRPTKGIAAMNSTVGSLSSGCTKASSVETNMGTKRLGMKDMIDSVPSGSCHPPTTGQEQLKSNCLSIGDNIDGQPTEVSSAKPDPDRIIKAPYEDSSSLHINDNSLVEESGILKQFMETYVPENIHVFEPCNEDSRGSEVSLANFSSEQQSDSKQIQEGNFGGDYMLHVGNKGDEVCTALTKDKLAARSTFCRTIDCSASTEVDSSCRSSEEQIAGEISFTTFLPQQGSDSKQLQESNFGGGTLTKYPHDGNFGGDTLAKHPHEGNFGGDHMAEHPYVGYTDGVDAVLTEGKSAVHSYCIPNSGSGLVAKKINCDAAAEAGPSFRSHEEQIAGEVSCTDFSSQCGSDSKQLQEGDFGEDNVAKHLHVGNIDGVSAVLSKGKLVAQNSYCIADSGPVHTSKIVNCGASTETESSSRLSREQIAVDVSCADFSSQQGSDSKQLQESNFGGENLSKHPHVGNTYGAYSVPSEDKLEAQNPYSKPDSGSGLPAKNVDSGDSTEAESYSRSKNEQIAGEAVSASSPSRHGSDFKQIQESKFGGDNLTKHPYVGNTGSETCTVPWEDNLAAQNSYCTPDLGSELTAKNIDCATSTEVELSFRSSKEHMAGNGSHSHLELDNSLGQDTGLTALIVSAGSACAPIVLSSTLSEESQYKPSEVMEFEDDEFQILSNSEIVSIEEKNVLKSDVVQLKNKVDAPPFSDEWVAALEAFGEDILQLKTGPVQNSPPDKSLAEPGPWSPVKRKAQEIGPFDCTKYSKNVSSSSTP